MESKLWSGVLKPFFPSSKGKKSSTHYNYKDTNFDKSFKLNSQGKAKYTKIGGNLGASS
jgi:hypothetical protein